MIKAPISLQDLRRRLYVKAKTERSGRHRCLGFGWQRWSREWLYERSSSFRSPCLLRAVTTLQSLQSARSHNP